MFFNKCFCSIFTRTSNPEKILKLISDIENIKNINACYVPPLLDEWECSFDYLNEKFLIIESSWSQKNYSVCSCAEFYDNEKNLKLYNALKKQSNKVNLNRFNRFIKLIMLHQYEYIGKQIFSKRKVKNYINSKNFRVGKDLLNSNKLNMLIIDILDRAIRIAKLDGRKIVMSKDIN